MTSPDLLLGSDQPTDDAPIAPEASLDCLVHGRLQDDRVLSAPESAPGARENCAPAGA